MHKGKVIILNGVSSSGKSTLIQKFVEKMPEYLKLSLDDIGGLIFNMRNQKRKPKTSEIVVETNHKISLKPYLFHRIISLIHVFSYNIIVDALFDCETALEDWENVFRDNNVVFVAVHCPLEELEKRERIRGDRPIGLAKSQLVSFHANIKYDIEINTFTNTTEECVQQIIDYINKINDCV